MTRKRFVKLLRANSHLLFKYVGSDAGKYFPRDFRPATFKDKSVFKLNGKDELKSYSEIWTAIRKAEKNIPTFTGKNLGDMVPEK